ncbi:uncharacterized protein LOC114932290 [Nylanderia fulva]|uniref:uncharacterized protein LOC114932290 n=1 Tax=Nylanderia fulva TaxID=613905 RepID=UPI0010FB945B|nr:uncharacterized protein LOC114932290 [Nylanderia fulva]XP_029160299.1 uncharacterized protein LOC114932290 [Nylanderia fulva]
MAAFNGIRVLPDIPKDIPSMETLIQEFETGFRSSSRQDTVSELSSSSGGSFVKKIVEAYESSFRASIENAEREHVRKRSGLFNTIRKQKNVEKSDSSPSMYDELGGDLRRWASLKNTSEKPSAFPVIDKHDLKDDFVTPNRYSAKSDKKTDISKTWSGISSKINKYGFMRELTNIRLNSSSSKRDEMEKLKIRDQMYYDSPGSDEEYKLTNNMPLICSSPLEDDREENPLDDILTNSRDSSSPSNNSYKNLQGDLYNFENEGWQFELSTSSPSLNSSRSLYGDTSSTEKNRVNDSLLLDSSVQDVTVIPSKDDLNDRETPQATEHMSKSPDLNRDSPRVIGISLKQPIRIGDDTSVTWIPVLNEKSSRIKSLKKLLSVFSRAKLSFGYKKIGRRLKRKQPKREHIFDSGFIERCPSTLSSFSQRSWHSDVGHVDDEPSTPPTFGTFGRPKCVSERCGRTVRHRRRIMLTEAAPKLVNDLEPKGAHRYVEFSSSVAGFTKSRVFCRYPSLPKHPHLIRSSVPKHPFVAKTKMDQIEEEEATAERKIEPDALKLTMRCPSTPISVPRSALNISPPKTSDLSAINNYDLPKSHKSTSALDEVVFRRQAPIYDVPRRSWLSSFTTDPLFVYGANRYAQNTPCVSRFATVSPKNFRFSLSHEKSRAIEKSFDN